MMRRHDASTIDAKVNPMIPYDIDPSLHDSEPTPERLGDGFSPPAQPAPDELVCEHLEATPELAIGEKSLF
jgi:hypothetical protein